MKVSVVILTFNSQDTIARTIASARKVSDDIHVVDSYSTDQTLEILSGTGVRLVQHPFENYSRQRNWAMAALPLAHAWELHLDADEYLSDGLIDELSSLSDADIQGVVGFLVPRLTSFLGRPIRHGGWYPIWHLRLFRRGQGRCERREYDQHFVVDGPVRQLGSPMVDDMRMSLSEWTTRHNRWSDAEVAHLTHSGGGGEVVEDWRGTPIEKRRFMRKQYNRVPLFFRAFLLFFYRYVVRLGFLDGKPGLIFFALQGFWFRFLIDAKLYEQTLRTKSEVEPNDPRHGGPGR